MYAHRVKSQQDLQRNVYTMVRLYQSIITRRKNNNGISECIFTRRLSDKSIGNVSYDFKNGYGLDYVVSETISHDFSRIIPWEELLEGEYTIKVNLEEMQALLYIIGNAAWDADTKSQEIRRKKIDALYGRLERKSNFPAKAMQNFKNYTEEK
jgi:hypothetical protein